MLNYARYSFLFLVVFLHSILIVLFVFTRNPFVIKYAMLVFENLHPASILALISGYLYFSTFQMTTLKEFMATGIYKKRIKRLLTPYLAWKFLIFGLFLITYCIIELVAHRGIDPHIIMTFFKRILISVFSSNNEEWTPQYMLFTPHLWYIHHLIIMFMLMPLLMHSKLIRFALPVILYFLYMAFPKMELLLHFRFVLFYVIGCVFGIYKSTTRKLFYFAINKYTVIIVLAFFVVITLFIKYVIHYDPQVIGIGVSSEYSDLPNTLYSFILPALTFLVVQCVLHNIGLKQDMKYEKGKHYMLYILHMYIIYALTFSMFLIPFFQGIRHNTIFVLS
ncbi:MAG: hypothetical protein EOP47_21080, partial [Sphingobacteriaceae bacterium]